MNPTEVEKGRQPGQLANEKGWIYKRRYQEAWRFAKLIGRQRRPEDTGKEISRSSQEAR
jgi:hypothetical protein